MMNGWGFFEETGNIEAYLLYLEYKKLLNGEYADELMNLEKAEADAGEDEGLNHSGDQPG